jgi:hypothetical protein
MSLHLLAFQCGLAECTANISTKFIILQPYKIIVAHSVLHPHCEVRIWHCRWFQESIFKDTDPKLTFYWDEAWHTLCA